jgi:hypothetical protein
LAPQDFAAILMLYNAETAWEMAVGLSQGSSGDDRAHQRGIDAKIGQSRGDGGVGLRVRRWPACSGAAMPYKANQARCHKMPKARYWIKNSPASDTTLRDRGDLTVSVTPAAPAAWHPPRSGRDQPDDVSPQADLVRPRLKPDDTHGLPRPICLDRPFVHQG